MWQDSISGIIARDSTDWQQDFVEALKESGSGVIWKDQLSDMNDILPKLRQLIKEKGFFYYYNISNNKTNYRAKIIDFATKDTYDDIAPDWKSRNPAWFCDDFASYNGNSQIAVIAFLVDEFKPIEPKDQIYVDRFITYNEKQASRKNAVAYLKIKTDFYINMKNIASLLRYSKNLILTGAPGTGKTYLAKQIAAQMILGKEYDENVASEKEKMEEQYDFVQFHPSYDYTDFVEGLRPIDDGKGNVSFRREDGIFMKFCRRALKAYNNATDEEKAPKYVFVIDEINRGELSKIFGELFFCIDPGYRGKDGKVKTQYNNLWKEDKFDDSDFFFIPKNVYIIGTMNDIDRSVESMDFAMRRRFAFKEVKAEDNMEMLKANEALAPFYDKIEERMNNLNLCILTIQGFTTAYQIGAAYFLKMTNYLVDGKVEDQSWMNLWENHLYGLLFEYLRGLPNAEDDLEKLHRAYKLEDKY